MWRNVIPPAHSCDQLRHNSSVLRQPRILHAVRRKLYSPPDVLSWNRGENSTTATDACLYPNLPQVFLCCFPSNFSEGNVYSTIVSTRPECYSLWTPSADSSPPTPFFLRFLETIFLSFRQERRDNRPSSVLFQNRKNPFSFFCFE